MSNKMNDLQARSLDQLSPTRRRFFGKLLAGTAAAAALPIMSSIAMADDDNDRPRGKGKGRPDGKGDRRGERPDAAQLAARLIKAHDANGDGMLDVKELTAALRAMQAGRGRRGKGEGGAGKGKGGGKGKGKGGAGGRPKRPT